MHHHLIHVICLLIGLVCLPYSATADTSTELKAAYQKAYDEADELYHSDDTKAYNAATKRLMDLCLKTNNEQMFYKAWSNQASYTLRFDIDKALEIGDQMRKYAKEHNSKYGFFVATYINSYMAKRLNKVDLAQKLSEEAIKYKRRYLPDVNGAFVYWQLADIYITKKQKQKAIRLLDRIKYEPDLKPSHHTFEWVYKCKAVYEIKPVDTVQFMAYYAEFEKAVEKYKHYEDPERMNVYRYAELTGDFEKLLGILRNTSFDSARQVIDTLKAVVERHRNGAEPNDDLTMMCLKLG